MSAPNAFDDLARRKLNEREHPFDEAAWNALQPELDALREKRRKRRFILWFTVLIGIGAASAWLLREQGASTADHVANEVPSAKSTETPTVKTNAGQKLVRVETTPTASEQSTPAEKQPIGSRAEQSAPRTSPALPDGTLTLMEPSPARGTAAAPTQPTVTDVPDKHGTGTEPAVNSASTPDPDPHVVITVEDDPSIPTPNDAAIADPIVVNETTEPTHTWSADTTTTTTSTVALTDNAATALATTTDTASFGPIMDTISVASTATLALPPLPQRKLELYACGGPFMTNTRYSGDHTKDWASTTTARRAYAYGIELMRQGEHFGFGAGLHYSTYAENIRASALTDEQRDWVTSYHLNAIDTSILIVNGSVWLNGQQYYATHMHDTTINVLVRTESEVVTRNERRSALSRSNRTSYLEVPLLFEAHVRRGSWSFALRGGPMLGILYGRRGQLPGTAGYTSLEEEAFSELVLGYTAQGHVRYHFGAQWSVGVGPAVRGQLLNTMQGDALQRRSTGTGGVISIGYRLP